MAIGSSSDKPTYVAIMGTVFDVSGNDAYAPNGSYHSMAFFSVVTYLFVDVANLSNLVKVFAGKDASRALALSSLQPQDCRPEYEDLGEKEKGVLNDWFTFFSKRYNIVGKVQI